MKTIRKQEMDIDECVSSLRNRVRQLHPWNPEGIVAYIVSRKTPEEIREYVLASDDQIRHLIVEAKSFSVPPEQQFLQLPPLQPPSWGHGLQFPHSELQFHPSSSFCGSQAPFPPFGQIGPWQPQFQPSGNFDGIQAPFAPNVPTAPCHFHLSMGCCKKGEDCRFSHESGFPEMHNKRQVHTLESLPMLEKEIRELLFSLQPPRVPIESLTSIYIERYGKPLRVEGFGAEGQQHGKAYYNLIGLLLRLNTTRVIERQGQHYIVPVEDAPKFLADDFKLVMPSAIYDSNKIYITFEPKSTFSKQDAWNYFSRYGPVHDVRIPLRQKRMFGYVSFLYPETVKRILSERSRNTPHFIGGDQVFVKACKKKHELQKLAQEDAHSNSGSHQLSDANVIYEHHSGIVTEKSSVNNVPEMASPPTHNLPVHSVNKAGPLQVDNMAESSHVSDRLDDAPATQDCDDYGLPENLDDIYL